MADRGIEEHFGLNRAETRVNRGEGTPGPRANHFHECCKSQAATFMIAQEVAIECFICFTPFWILFHCISLFVFVYTMCALKKLCLCVILCVRDSLYIMKTDIPDAVGNTD